jgi:hypothetical protein
MATVKTNIWNLKAGDVITFISLYGYKTFINVNRVEEKSWYGGQGEVNGRNSYGTLEKLSKLPEFQIIRK